jgi:hypothetical protein
MATYQRGVAKKITVEFEYPDGSHKVAEVANPEQVGMIAFDDLHVRAHEAGAFNVSEADGSLNPAMVVYPKSSGEAAAGIPICDQCSHR